MGSDKEKQKQSVMKGKKMFIEKSQIPVYALKEKQALDVRAFWHLLDKSRD